MKVDTRALRKLIKSSLQSPGNIKLWVNDIGSSMPALSGIENNVNWNNPLEAVAFEVVRKLEAYGALDDEAAREVVASTFAERLPLKENAIRELLHLLSPSVAPPPAQSPPSPATPSTAAKSLEPPLTQQQFRELFAALKEAYPKVEALEVMLALGFGLNLESITLAGTLDKRILDVVNHFKRRHRTIELVIEANAGLGEAGNPRLTALLHEIDPQRVNSGGGTVSTAYAATLGKLDAKNHKPALERILQGAAAFNNPRAYIAKLSKICGAVARIERNQHQQLGSAFLVGANVLLTNYHVVENIRNSQDAAVRFDFASDERGIGVDSGVVHRLHAKKWLLGWRPPSPNDPDGEAEATELDYALICLETNASQDDVSYGKRGFIRLDGRDVSVDKSELLNIVQYPAFRPLQFATGFDGTYRFQERRLRYNVNTQPGSSGSPVLDNSFNVVALHHSGDGKKDRDGKGYNQGVPIERILEDIEEQGLSHLIGKEAMV